MKINQALINSYARNLLGQIFAAVTIVSQTSHVSVSNFDGNSVYGSQSLNNNHSEVERSNNFNIGISDFQFLHLIYLLYVLLWIYHYHLVNIFYLH